jgi:tetratricopeptide (TPR) repeat protein
MQVEMPVLNRSLVRGLSVRRAAWRLPLSMTLIVVCCFSSAQAQSDAAGKPPSREASTAGAATTEQTRSRRVAETSNATGDEAAQGETGESGDNPALAVGKADDRVATLRVQIEAAKTDSERARLQRMLIDYLVALGKKSEAIGELRVMSREERLDPIGFYNIGNQLARLGDTDTAIDAYRKAIKQRHGNYARALNNLGVMFLRQGRWDEAQVEFVNALRLENFRYGEASYNLGRVYSARGEADLAIREWTRALSVQPDHTDAAIALARAYAEDGSPERGIEVLDTFVARRGPSAEIMEARREILFGSEGDVESKSAAASTTNVSGFGNPVSVGPAVSRTTSAPVTAKTNREVNARKAGGAKPGSPKRANASLRSLTVDRETYGWLERARAAREGGRNEEAATFYRRVLARSNGLFPPANLELSFVLTEMKRYDEAAETLSIVAKREGARYPIAYYHLGRQYEMLGRLDLAAEAFEKAAAADGDTNPQFFLDLSRVREKEGNAQAALTAMETYVRLSQSLGRAPDWSSERLAELRQKAEAKK